MTLLRFLPKDVSCFNVVLLFDSSCFSAVPRHAAGLTFHFQSPAARLVWLVKL